MDSITSLKNLIHKWGGTLIKIHPDDFNFYTHNANFFQCPFNVELGFFWNDKAIVYYNATWPEILHEMGHVFASKKPPSHSDEGEFFGWEYCVAKSIKAPVQEWVDNNKDYAVNNPGKITSPSDKIIDFGELSDSSKIVVLKKAIEESKAAGLFKNNKPIAIR